MGASYNNRVKLEYAFGLLFFPLLGLLTKVSKNKNYRLILSTITTMFWFVPLFIYSIIIKILKKL